MTLLSIRQNFSIFKMILSAVWYLYSIFSVVQGDFLSERDDFIEKELMYIPGANTTLTHDEENLNSVLMSFKMNEIEIALADPETFLLRQPFFKIKSRIEQSFVFRLIQNLPKGCSLNANELALSNADFIYNLTFKENLYAYTRKNRLRLHFFKKPPSCHWMLVSELRKNESYDAWLKEQISIIQNGNYFYKNTDDAWTCILNTYETIRGMLFYKPVWEEYFQAVLGEFYDDNVMYIEMRTLLSEFYDLDGNTFNVVEAANFYKEQADKFKKLYPDFQGLRLIYSPYVSAVPKVLDKYLDNVKHLREKHPDFVIGFDMTRREVDSMSLLLFVDFFKQVKKLGLQLFISVGSTNWFGVTRDMNIMDAILIGASRLGNAYAAIKHPLAMKYIKERNILLEISPISNQIMCLLNDLRNHPGVFYIANGYPVVVSPDDPSIWGAKGLSYDWYGTFMALVRAEVDLKFLKHIALNSYLYSAMGEEEKKIAIAEWETRWGGFIRVFLSQSKVKIN